MVGTLSGGQVIPLAGILGRDGGYPGAIHGIAPRK